MNEITKITILHTENGIDMEPILDIYVDEDPFVCLTTMFTQYFIYSYNGHTIFHPYLTSIPYCVEIKTIGSAKNLANFALPRYPNIKLAIDDNTNVFFKANISQCLNVTVEEREKRKSEYYQFLATAKEKIEPIQAAIDYSDIISISNDVKPHDEYIEAAQSKTIEFINKYGFNKYTAPLFTYALAVLSHRI